VFPLLARDGGVLVRAGHTEAAVDLAKMAGFSGAGVICEIMNDDGTMARLPNLIGFAQRHGLKIGTIESLIAYRRRTESLVKRVHEGAFSSRYGGEFRLIVYVNTLEYAEHVALVKGDISKADKPIPVRMHAVDFIADILGGAKDSTLHRAMEIIGKEGCGAIVIIRDSSPAALSQRLKGQATPSGSTLRNYGIGAQILLDLGIRNMELLSDNPKNVVGLEGYGLYITGHRPIRG
jgi:3,4-dihydroxy 2-butanone 4-phosphate synthase/GTP cyclohydrolase II